MKVKDAALDETFAGTFLSLLDRSPDPEKATLYSPDILQTVPEDTQSLLGQVLRIVAAEQHEFPDRPLAIATSGTTPFYGITVRKWGDSESEFAGVQGVSLDVISRELKAKYQHEAALWALDVVRLKTGISWLTFTLTTAEQELVFTGSHDTLPQGKTKPKDFVKFLKAGKLPSMPSVDGQTQTAVDFLDESGKESIEVPILSVTTELSTPKDPTAPRYTFLKFEISTGRFLSAIMPKQHIAEQMPLRVRLELTKRAGTPAKVLTPGASLTLSFPRNEYTTNDRKIRVCDWRMTPAKVVTDLASIQEEDTTRELAAIPF